MKLRKNYSKEILKSESIVETACFDRLTAADGF